MVDITKKSGQIAKKFSRFARKTTEKSKEHIKSNFLSRFRNAMEVRLLIFEWVLLVSVVTLLAIVQSMLYQDSYQAPVFVSGGSYSEATIGDIKSLNPLFAATSSEKTASSLLFATLLAVDSAGHLDNQLARSLSHDESGKVWTLTLRDGLKWSDGEPIVADDIVYTFDTIKSSTSHTIYADTFSRVAVAKTDDLTVTFTLPTVFVDFPTTLTIPILPSHILGEVDPALLHEHAFSLNPITSGPFIFSYIQQADTQQTLILAKNPHYFRGEPMLDRFMLQTYPTEEEVIAAVENHEVTATAALLDGDIVSSSIYRKNAAINRGAFAFFNVTSPFMSNIGLRRAIRFGIDQGRIRDDLSITMPLDLPILPSQADLTFPAVPEYNQVEAMNQIGAAGLVQKSGKLYTADDKPVEITIATVKTGYLAEYAEAIASELDTLGFTPILNIFESSESQMFFQSVIQPRAYDILLYEVDLGLTPDLLPYYHSTQANANGYNFSNYQSTVASDLLLSARTTFDAELRRSKYESFLRHWVDDVPAIGLYQSELTYLYNRATRNFSENTALVTGTDRFSDVLYWAAQRDTRFRTP